MRRRKRIEVEKRVIWFSLSSPKEGEGRGEEANEILVRTRDADLCEANPSPQPSPRLGGEREKRSRVWTRARAVNPMEVVVPR